MAGAVSAGAYTAGVVDYLLEALESWEKVRDQPGVPPHKVTLSALCGTSAGGMTSTLLAVLQDRDFGPVRRETPEPQRKNNWLYRAWVEEIDISHFLKTHDLEKKDEPLRSLLDCTVLDQIVDRFFAELPPRREPRPYISNKLDLVLSLTNLRGIPFSIDFQSAAAEAHGLSMHADYTHFRFCLDADASSDIRCLDLANPDPNGHPDWALLRESTLATGAFPVALRSRKIAARVGDYRQQRLWFNPIDRLVAPNFDPQWPDQDPLEYIAVDGGAINNEPFDYMRRLMGSGSETSENQVILMVDPFPGMDSSDAGDGQDGSLFGAFTGLFSSLKNQARFKFEDLLDSYTGRSNRFLIAPQRRSETSNEVVHPALACSSLGAFGGFLKRDFRLHDFYLGRRNCQRFLQRHFTLREDHSLFASWTDEMKNRYRVTRSDGVSCLPIVPLVSDATAIAPMHPWPEFREDELAAVMKGIGHRTDAVYKRSTESLGFLTRSYLFIGWLKVRKQVFQKIESSLREGLSEAHLWAEAPGAATSPGRVSPKPGQHSSRRR